MTPIIVFDEHDDFFLTLGSPGGKAIISYIFRVLIDVLYSGIDPRNSIPKPNYIRINGRTFIEEKKQNILLNSPAKVRNLTSGLAIIKKEGQSFLGVADFRRDGTVKGK